CTRLRPTCTGTISYTREQEAAPRPAGRPRRGSRGMPETVYAALDVGSNTVHLLVAAVDGRSLRALDDRSELLRLGTDLELTGAIGPAKLAAAVECVRGYGERARRLGARQVLV